MTVQRVSNENDVTPRGPNGNAWSPVFGVCGICTAGLAVIPLCVARNWWGVAGIVAALIIVLGAYYLIRKMTVK